MSQSTQTLTTGVGGDSVASSVAKMNSNWAAAWSLQSGATAPTNPPTYLLWLDTSGSPVLALKINTGTPGAPVWVTLMANVAVAAGGLLPLSGGTMTGPIAMGSQKITSLASGTASGDAVNKGQVDTAPRCFPLHLGTISATDEKFILIVPANTTIIGASIVSELGVASSGVNYWTFQIRNLTAGVNLAATAKTTNGAAITADAAYALTTDQNLSPATNDVLELQMTKTGAPNNLQEMLLVLNYRIAIS